MVDQRQALAALTECEARAYFPHRPRIRPETARGILAYYLDVNPGATLNEFDHTNPRYNGWVLTDIPNIRKANEALHAFGKADLFPWHPKTTRAEALNTLAAYFDTAPGAWSEGDLVHTCDREALALRIEGGDKDRLRDVMELGQAAAMAAWDREADLDDAASRLAETFAVDHVLARQAIEDLLAGEKR